MMFSAIVTPHKRTYISKQLSPRKPYKNW